VCAKVQPRWPGPAERLHFPCLKKSTRKMSMSKLLTALVVALGVMATPAFAASHAAAAPAKKEEMKKDAKPAAAAASAAASAAAKKDEKKK
jgi:hypothetical protein